MAPSKTRPCPHFLAHFSAFVDGTLKPAHRARLEAHLDCCEPCLRHLRAYRRGVTTYRALEDEGPSELWVGLEERIRRLETAEAERGLAPFRASQLPSFGLAVAAVLATLIVWAGGLTDLAAPDAGATHPVSMASVVPGIADPAVTRARPAAGRVAVARRSDPGYRPPVLRTALAETRPADPWSEPIEIREVELRVVHASMPLPWSAEAALSLP